MHQKKQNNVVWSFLQRLPNNYMVKYEKSFIIYSNKENSEYQIYTSLSPLMPSQGELFIELDNQFQDIQESLNQQRRGEIYGFLYSLRPKFERLEQMPKIKKLKKLTFTDDDTCVIQEDAEIQFKNGIVYLLNFWGEKDNQSYDNYLESSKQIFENNKQWKGKAQVIWINLVQSTDVIIEKIKQNKWQHIEHYQMEKKDIIKLILQCRFGNHFIVMINKQEKIEYIGDTLFINVEDRINQYIEAEDIREENQESQENQEISPIEESITEAEYKVVKQQLKKISDVIKETGFNGQVDLKLKKHSLLKPDGTITFNSCSKLELNYDVDVRDTPLINEFLQNYWSQVPENAKKVTTQIFRDSEKSFTRFKEVFNSLGAEIYYKQVNAQNQKLYVKNPDFETFLTAQEILRIDAFNNDYYQFDNLLQELKLNSFNFSEGKQYFPIIKCKKYGEEELTSIKHVLGQILIVAFQGDSADKDLIKIEDLLEKNSEKWGKSVRMVVLYRTEIYSQESKYLEFYCATYYSFCSAFMDYSKDPNYYFVDKFGIIRNISFDQQMIDDLLQEEVPCKDE